LLIAIKFNDLFSIRAAEIIFTLTSALTICYFIKLFRGVFMGKVPEKLDRKYPLALSTRIVLGTFAVAIVAIGLFPNYILENFLLRPAELLQYEGYAMDHLYHFHFFDWEMLKAMVIVVILSLIIYLPGVRLKWFDWRPPPWLSIYALFYQPLTNRLMAFTCRAGLMIDTTVDNAYTSSGNAARSMCGYVVDMEGGLDKFYKKWGLIGRKLAEGSRNMDQKLDQFYLKTGKAAKKLADKSADMDSALDNAYEKTGKTAQKLARQSANLDQALNVVYDQAGKKTREEIDKRLAAEKEKDKKGASRKWTTKNLSFDNLILILVLGLVLFIIFYFGRSL